MTMYPGIFDTVALLPNNSIQAWPILDIITRIRYSRYELSLFFSKMNISIRKRHQSISYIRQFVPHCTFFPRMTTPGSPWITMYFVPPTKRPVGARVPGSSKSFMIPETSSGFNCKKKHETWTWEHRDKRTRRKRWWIILWTQGCNNWWHSMTPYIRIAT